MTRYRGMFGDRPDNMPKLPTALKKLTPVAHNFLLEFAKDPDTFVERHIFYKKCLHHNRHTIQGITWTTSSGARLISRELMIKALGERFILNCDSCLYKHIGANG